MRAYLYFYAVMTAVTAALYALLGMPGLVAGLAVCAVPSSARLAARFVFGIHRRTLRRTLLAADRTKLADDVAPPSGRAG